MVGNIEQHSHPQKEGGGGAGAGPPLLKPNLREEVRGERGSVV